MKKFPLLPIFLTVFIELVGMSIVIPVAAPLFLGSDSLLFDPRFTIEYRTLVLGLLLFIAPLIQFFSSPLMGAYSDRVGRKRVLLFSVFLTGIGHLLFGFAVMTGHIWLLFISRILAGAGAGNISTANSATADLSTHESKARNFGLIGTAAGLGIIFGPLLGGKLSDPTVVSWFNYATPLWFAALLSLVNLLFILVAFRETLTERIHRSMDVFTGTRNLIRAFTMPNLRLLYGVNFLFSFGFNFFTQFFSVFLVARFGFGAGEIGTLVAYVGLWLAFTQGILTRVLSRFMAPITVIRSAPLVAAATLLILARVQHVETTYLLLPVVALAYGVTPPNLTALISDASDKESQGEALGINGSMSALSFGLPPLVAAVAITINVALPLIFAGGFILLAWLIFVRFHRPLTQPVFHEV
jgi:DHA1 family tetracycline resistance protein-like MFS transporter